ncbi:glycine zipper 2TM domain-containing protein [Sulfurirhabdus autotrophica]|uniref:Outer membrane lipoprotein SlyB n=1 Tax=Sulfurirhabdus autotrophica TaxID=1706046 RepID=A0A4R3YF96_9PROT|nr:glycine zipper 2TM domain-containing protein [Sulfurirhabdus autotrophica]TCV90582.1 outer membrane lipoprotein SlyB [Sulfurirhabdus autotrophica]
MNLRFILPLVVTTAFFSGCAEMGSLGGTRYGETSNAPVSQTERYGTITKLEYIQVDENYKLGVGTAAGAVAGGILGSEIGDSGTATIAGAVLGGLAGTYAESKVRKQDAQRIIVRMNTGGTLTIEQPVDTRLRSGMNVRVEGSGQNARVLPR